MHAAYVSVTIATIVITAVAATVDFIRFAPLLDTMARVKVPESWLRPLGLLKAAGAMGLLLGLSGVPAIGEAAAIGLILFFTGAFVTHIRAGEYRSMAFPGVFFVMAVTTLALTVAV